MSPARCPDLSFLVAATCILHFFLVQRNFGMNRSSGAATWSCGVCTLINDGRADTCYACGVGERLDTSKQRPDGNSKILHGVESDPDHWTCDACTFRNAAAARSCTVCQSSGPGAATLAATVMGTEVTGETATTRTPDIVGKIAAAFAEASTHRRLPSALRVCAETDHFSQRTGPGSNSTCGYRNCQMIASSLARNPAYRVALFKGDGVIPGVPELMRRIEVAWARGFDPMGRSEMGGQLSFGKWIGTAEAAVLFRSFGINARLITFHAFDSPDIATVSSPEVARLAASARAAADAELLRTTGLFADAVLYPWKHQRRGGRGGASAAVSLPSDEDASSTRGTGVALSSGDVTTVPPHVGSHAAAVRRYMARRHAALVGWMRGYFQSSSAAPSDVAPFPVYLQHDGHSRTLAGYELRRVGARPDVAGDKLGLSSGRSLGGGTANTGGAAQLRRWLGGCQSSPPGAGAASDALYVPEVPTNACHAAPAVSSALATSCGVKRSLAQLDDAITISSDSDADCAGVVEDEIAFVSSTALARPLTSRRFVAGAATSPARLLQQTVVARVEDGVASSHVTGSSGPGEVASTGTQPCHREFLGGAVRGYFADPALFDSDLLLMILDPVSHPAALSTALRTQKCVVAGLTVAAFQVSAMSCTQPSAMPSPCSGWEKQVKRSLATLRNPVYEALIIEREPVKVRASPGRAPALPRHARRRMCLQVGHELESLKELTCDVHLVSM